jgi:hypothetical protein
MDHIFYAKCLFEKFGIDEIRNFVSTTFPYHYLEEEVYATIAYSRSKVDWPERFNNITATYEDLGKFHKGISISHIEYIGKKGTLCLVLNAPILNNWHYLFKSLGASHDFDAYIPHISLKCSDKEGGFNYSNIFVSPPKTKLYPSEIIISSFEEKEKEEVM